MKLEGKVALVTGASRGIGKAIALQLASEGADVIVNYAGSQQSAEQTASDIVAMGRRSLAIRANVGIAEEVDSMVQTAISEFGKIDILVNNAGITRDNLLMRMKEEEFDEVININLKGVFNCIKAVTRPMMKERYGKIINISSVVASLGNAGQANYVAAKAGVIGLTKTTARELASRGIQVNAIAPGFIETDMTGKLTDDIKANLLKQIPLGTFGQPEDIAKLALFLASDDSRYITGQVLHVDGGMYM